MAQRASFEPLQLAVAADFWGALARRKLVELRLSEAPVPLCGYYEPGVRGRPALVHLTCASLDAEAAAAPDASVARVRVPGSITLYNTRAAYEAADRGALAAAARAAVEAGGAARLWVLAHADLKRHVFRYHALHAAVFDASVWFSVAALGAPRPPSDAQPHLDGTPFAKCGARVLFVDPSGGAFPVFGWPLRNLLYVRLVRDRLPFLDVDVLRSDALFGVRIAAVRAPDAAPGVHVTGWERDAAGRACERVVDLSVLMDGAQLAAEANALNLRLMRWRLAPDVDLGVFARQRVLLVGAGTLGCNVARLLLGWGVRAVTFVDCGRVSYSNPVRQSLFVHADCAGGGRPKALAAAAALRAIDPGCAAAGEDLAVPMPGHRVGAGCAAAVRRLWDAVAAHDAVFCLTDSREARWLPAVLGGVCGKAVLTIAMGFDTYVAMRHGPSVLYASGGGSITGATTSGRDSACLGDRDRGPDQADTSADAIRGVADRMASVSLGAESACLSGRDRGPDQADAIRHSSSDSTCDDTEQTDLVCAQKTKANTTKSSDRVRRGSGAMRLGCYFCSDAGAPADTTSGRPLDQQCTVSRPGVSMMAAAAGVELYAAMLQHPAGPGAPAFLAMPTVYDSLDVADSESPCDSGAAQSGVDSGEMSGGGKNSSPPTWDGSSHETGSAHTDQTTARTRGSRLSGALGIVPHQIRGFVSHQQQVHLLGAAYEHCTACSRRVLAAVRDGGPDAVVRMLERPAELAAPGALSAEAHAADAHASSGVRQEDDFVLV